MASIDEAFLPFHAIVERIIAVPGEISDPEAGVRSYVYEIEIESPVELDLVRGDSGSLQIGTVPPLYRVDTTLQPVFHNLRIKAVLDEAPNGK